jgi:hypothetical protein
MEKGMELVYVLIGTVVVVAIFYVASGPRDTVKKVENIRILTDESLSIEINRILSWVNRYNGLDEKWKAKAATREAANGYNNYLVELNGELARRQFFYELIEYSPMLKLLLPAAYGELLNDGIIKIAWDLKRSGTSMPEIISWYKKELGMEEPPIEIRNEESPTNENLRTLSKIIEQIPPFIIFRFEPTQKLLIACFEALGISHAKYTYVVFIASAAFCFSQITNRSLFSKSEEEMDYFLNEICKFEQFQVLENSKSFKENCKKLLHKIIENPATDPRVIVNKYFEKAFPVQNNENYETIHRYFNHWHIRPITTSVNDAFLRAGYMQYV